MAASGGKIARTEDVDLSSLLVPELVLHPPLIPWWGGGDPFVLEVRSSPAPPIVPHKMRQSTLAWLQGESQDSSG